MKIITHEAILDTQISPLMCYHWAEEAIRNKADVMLPPKISLKPREGVFYNTMPVLLPGISRGGVKVVNRYPENLPSLDSQILLYDISNGECLALMDANWITAMRTGAVAAHSMKLFAREDFKVIGLIGLGNVMRSTLEVFLALYPERELVLRLLRYKNQHELFAERFAEYRNVKFEFVDSYSDAVEGADIVVEAATYLGQDICTLDCIEKGALVVPIHTRGFTQFDYQFDRIYADDTGHVSEFVNFKKYACFAEVADVVNGKAPARLNDEERIIVYNIGIALHDIYFASKIYEMMDERCPDITLNSISNKFWV